MNRAAPDVDAPAVNDSNETSVNHSTLTNASDSTIPAAVTNFQTAEPEIPAESNVMTIPARRDSSAGQFQTCQEPEVSDLGTATL